VEDYFIDAGNLTQANSTGEEAGQFRFIPIHALMRALSNTPAVFAHYHNTFL
jgi:hypothetical protein